MHCKHADVFNISRLNCWQMVCSQTENDLGVCSIRNLHATAVFNHRDLFDEVLLPGLVRREAIRHTNSYVPPDSTDFVTEDGGRELITEVVHRGSGDFPSLVGALCFALDFKRR